MHTYVCMYGTDVQNKSIVLDEIMNHEQATVNR